VHFVARRADLESHRLSMNPSRGRSLRRRRKLDFSNELCYLTLAGNRWEEIEQTERPPIPGEYLWGSQRWSPFVWTVQKALNIAQPRVGVSRDKNNCVRNQIRANHYTSSSTFSMWNHVRYDFLTERLHLPSLRLKKRSLFPIRSEGHWLHFSAFHPKSYAVSNGFYFPRLPCSLNPPS